VIRKIGPPAGKRMIAVVNAVIAEPGQEKEKNKIHDNRGVGVSIGHRDTDNLVRENEIKGSGQVGVLFRPERGKSFAPHRNRLERNKILDNAPEGGAAIARSWRRAGRASGPACASGRRSGRS
jgi:hypothetical protein